MELVGASWWALKMTFGVIPGICLVGYVFELGTKRGKFGVAGYLQLMNETNSAKDKAMKTVGGLFIPWKPALGALLISGILFSLSGDLIMLFVINLIAIPVAVFSYFQGARMRKEKGKVAMITADPDDPNFEAKYSRIYKALTPYLIRIGLLWLILAGLSLGVAYLLDWWTPS